jgi:hypothetical protein|tara:strand:- start:14715 stop:15320 length:606 start_codon:yes stop_codon:yes gene_type:complete
MGRSDPHMFRLYAENIKPRGEVAQLGSTDNRLFRGELFDRGLDNWEINSDWVLGSKYDTIICTRCAYFAKDLTNFFKRAHDHLEDGGVLYVDFGIGDHWRYDNYKIGWKKDGEQESAYWDENYLWSFVWDDKLLEDEEFKKFSKYVEKKGYPDVKAALFDETPEIMELDKLKDMFDVTYETLTLWEESPQFNVLLKCAKRE